MRVNLKEAEYFFVCLIPMSNVLVNITVSPELTGFHMGITRAISLLLFCLYFLFKRFQITDISIYYLSFLTYFLILTTFSNDIFYSLYYYAQLFLITISFLIGYQYLNSIDRLIVFQKYTFWAFVILSGYIIYAIVFQVGTPAYRGEAFYTGNAGVNATKNMVFVLLCMPLLFIKSHKPKIYLFFTLIFLILIFLALKRSAVLGVASGVCILLILYPKYKSIFKYILISILLLIITSPFYIHLFYQSLDSREAAIEQMINAPSTIQI